MSRSVRMIPRKPYFEFIRHVCINRNGIPIGNVVRFMGRKAYMTWRKHPKLGAKGRGHYMITDRGFAIDRNALLFMVSHDMIEMVIVEYMGPRGLRYFVSSIDDWIMHSRDMNYSKVEGDSVETYEPQKALCESYMDELEVMA